MTLRKGYKIQFKTRTETIISASNNPIRGRILTDRREYSTDFIQRWIKFGFISIEKST